MTNFPNGGPSKFAVRLRMLMSAALLLWFVGAAHAESTLRVGHFPNITHIQALVAHGALETEPSRNKPSGR
jgi:hypothetical protein